MSIKKKSESIKRIINDYISSDIPPALKDKYRSFLFLSVLVLVGGIGITLMFTTKISAMSFPLLISAGLFCFAVVYKGSIVINGYTQIEGIVIDYQNGILTSFSKNAVDSFIIETPEGLYEIPSARRKQPVPIGSNVVVYTAPKSKGYTTRSGYTRINTIYGYAVKGFS